MNLRKTCRWLYHFVTSANKRPYIGLSLKELSDEISSSSAKKESFRLLGIFDELTYRVTSTSKRDALKARVAGLIERFEGEELQTGASRQDIETLRQKLLQRYAEGAEAEAQAAREAEARRQEQLAAEEQARQEAEAQARKAERAQREGRVKGEKGKPREKESSRERKEARDNNDPENTNNWYDNAKTRSEYIAEQIRRFKEARPLSKGTEEKGSENKDNEKKPEGRTKSTFRKEESEGHTEDSPRIKDEEKETSQGKPLTEEQRESWEVEEKSPREETEDERTGEENEVLTKAIEENEDAKAEENEEIKQLEIEEEKKALRRAMAQARLEEQGDRNTRKKEDKEEQRKSRYEEVAETYETDAIESSVEEIKGVESLGNAKPEANESGDAQQLHLDESQTEAISQMCTGDVVCIAPPGHGKTRIAIEGIKEFLVNSRGESSGENVLFISFTKAAVREAKERFTQCKEARGVLCMTLDSLCGHLGQVVKTGLGVELRAEGYEENIELFERAITTGGKVSAFLRDFISESIDLMIVDEAQDLTGNRLALVKSIIDYLHEDAKCTILCDPIQAIYSYQENETAQAPLSEWCLDIGYREFKEIELSENHRTKNPRLALTTAKARDIYKEDLVPERLKVMKTLEYGNSVGGIELIEPAGDLGLMKDGFHMFRRNVDALSFYLGQREAGKRYGLRLSGKNRMAHPIIAELSAVAGRGKSVSEDEVWKEIDAEEIEKRMEMQSFGDIYDKIVRDYGNGSKKHEIDLESIERDLDRNQLPEFLTQDVIGNSRAVCGSIHSFKGRECRNGVLYLDSNLKSTNAEEFRVFYVAITRPSHNLEIRKINAPAYEPDKINKRAFYRNSLEIEIGLEGDIVWSTNAKDYEETQFGAHQRWLRKNCFTSVELEAILFEEKDEEPKYDLITKGTGRYIGCFDKWLSRKIYYSYRNVGRMPRRFTKIYMLGTESVTVKRYIPNEVGEECGSEISQSLLRHSPRMVLMPIVGGIAKPQF